MGLRSIVTVTRFCVWCPKPHTVHSHIESTSTNAFKKVFNPTLYSWPLRKVCDRPAHLYYRFYSSKLYIAHVCRYLQCQCMTWSHDIKDWHFDIEQIAYWGKKKYNSRVLHFLPNPNAIEAFNKKLFKIGVTRMNIIGYESFGAKISHT